MIGTKKEMAKNNTLELKRKTKWRRTRRMGVELQINAIQPSLFFKIILVYH